MILLWYIKVIKWVKWAISTTSTACAIASPGSWIDSWEIHYEEEFYLPNYKTSCFIQETLLSPYLWWNKNLVYQFYQFSYHSKKIILSWWSSGEFMFTYGGKKAKTHCKFQYLTNIVLDEASTLMKTIKLMKWYNMTVGKAAYSPASGKSMIRSKRLVKVSISDPQNQPKRISLLLTITNEFKVKLTKTIPEWCSAVLAPCHKYNSGEVWLIRSSIDLRCK